MNISIPIAEALPPALAQRFREILDDVRVAPPSEKLTAFCRAARGTVREIVGPHYLLRDAADRLWTTAEVHGLVEKFGENIIQSELAAAFEDPAAKNDRDALDGIAIAQATVEIPPVVRAIELERFLEMEIPRRAMLLGPWLPEQGLAMVHAFRGVGKTELILGTGYAVATGTGFLRWKAEKPRRTLLIDGEMPGSVLQDRINRVVGAAGSLPEPGFFRIVASDLHRDGLPDLSDPRGQQFYADAVADADLIIADNLSTLCPGYKENDADTWGPIQAWALGRRREGKSCLFVHHDGKGGAQRGTSRKEDVLDAVIGLKRPPGYSPDQGARFEVHFEKNRGFHGIDAEPFEVRRVGDQWEISPIKAGDDPAIVRELHEQGLSIRAIAERTGLSKSKVGRCVNGDDE
jgi:hypothetical protein